jgi:hypothetical protein
LRFFHAPPRPRRTEPADSIGAAPKRVWAILPPAGPGRRRGACDIRVAPLSARPTGRFSDGDVQPQRTDIAVSAATRSANSKGQAPLGLSRRRRGTRGRTHGAAPRSSVESCDRDGARCLRRKIMWATCARCPSVRDTGASRHPLGCFAGCHAATLAPLGVVGAIFKGGCPFPKKKKWPCDP